VFTGSTPKNWKNSKGAIVPEHALNVKVNIPVKANGPLAKKEASAVSNK
jgi:hypothetical protein